MEVTKLTNELLVNNLGILLFKHLSVGNCISRTRFISKGETLIVSLTIERKTTIFFAQSTQSIIHKMRSVVADNVFGRSKSAEDLISNFSATFLAVAAIQYVPWSRNHDFIFDAMFLINQK
jgi:hypothetical protein